MAERSRRDPDKADRSPKRFEPATLNQTTIALPLLRAIERNRDDTPVHVIIDLNLDYSGLRDEAKKQVLKALKAFPDVEAANDEDDAVDRNKTQFTPQYVFARLKPTTIQKLAAELAVSRATADQSQALIYKIWPDFEIRRSTCVSISTVKADAAHAAFGALGAGITWAVLDTGVDESHPHFADHKNLQLSGALRHRDFTAPANRSKLKLKNLATRDLSGHGTHVAGIIAGAMKEGPDAPIRVEVRATDADGSSMTRITDLKQISGMAPATKVLSLKVLDDNGNGQASNCIAALGYIQQINGNGRRLKVHGVNMSVGYIFEPEWFACGQSPLCVEVDRLVRSGVVVVVAAGNTGYGSVQAEFWDGAPAGLDVTINDPGNAELAITVGSTHREMPHTYGVSYFSSKGPTGDGRLKPDLLAPGEKIISCRSSQRADAPAEPGVRYCEDSGTSMAAPHVSGVIAAFLSIRREFIGRPETVKEIFLATATDLKRAAYFQGRGLVDLMRAIQSV